MAKNDARTQNIQKNATKNATNPTAPSNTSTKPTQNTKSSGNKQK